MSAEFASISWACRVAVATRFASTGITPASASTLSVTETSTASITVTEFSYCAIRVTDTFDTSVV